MDNNWTVINQPTGGNDKADTLALAARDVTAAAVDAFNNHKPNCFYSNKDLTEIVIKFVDGCSGKEKAALKKKWRVLPLPDNDPDVEAALAHYSEFIFKYQYKGKEYVIFRGTEKNEASFMPQPSQEDLGYFLHDTATCLELMPTDIPGNLPPSFFKRSLKVKFVSNLLYYYQGQSTYIQNCLNGFFYETLLSTYRLRMAAGEMETARREQSLYALLKAKRESRFEVESEEIAAIGEMLLQLDPKLGTVAEGILDKARALYKQVETTRELAMATRDGMCYQLSQKDQILQDSTEKIGELEEELEEKSAQLESAKATIAQQKKDLIEKEEKIERLESSLSKQP